MRGDWAQHEPSAASFTQTSPCAHSAITPTSHSLRTLPAYSTTRS
ncbi:hypothetical protein MIZ03_2717 [Rhodoferax lithotrophicus]|uniref:Uncharacterized protein n=1 Tax=Rhodoferax lithotrophicus TaxID=2798804 RepID=A0ABN6DAD2_9BURK|nr:hypothetical protein MIZ03_2717 [Rhodoferax sp. MIZ03]